MKFTYLKTAEETRLLLVVLGILLIFEIPIHIGLWHLPFPWNVTSSALLLTLEVTLTGLLLSFFFTCHRVADGAIRIHAGIWAKAAIPLENVRSCDLYRGRVPDGDLSTPFVGFADDTLFLLLSRKSLVSITLSQDHPVRLNRKRPAAHRLVLSLDEPARFVAEVNKLLQTGKKIRLRRFFGIDIDAAAQHQQPGRKIRLRRFFGMEPVVSPVHVPEPEPCGENVQNDVPLLEICRLTKRYGEVQAVDNVSFDMYKGEILGLVGRNGAGKSSLMRMIAGQSRITEGRIVYRFPDGERPRTGYVPDSPALYDDLTAYEFLSFISVLCGHSKKETRIKVETQLAMGSLERYGNKLIGGFSLGMRKRLAIAAALLPEPQLLILDEVTNGLDPVVNHQVKEQLTALANGGCSILLSSHILDLIAGLARRVVIMEEGAVRYVGPIKRQPSDEAETASSSLEDVYLTLVEKGTIA
ncbi:MAG: ABC transporter ATP-binding protein [Bacilli bacterium]